MKQTDLKQKIIVRAAVMAGCSALALLLRAATIDEFGIGTTAGNVVFACGLILFTAMYFGLSSNRKSESATMQTIPVKKSDQHPHS